MNGVDLSATDEPDGIDSTLHYFLTGVLGPEITERRIAATFRFPCVCLLGFLFFREIMEVLLWSLTCGTIDSCVSCDGRRSIRGSLCRVNCVEKNSSRRTRELLPFVFSSLPSLLFAGFPASLRDVVCAA